MDIICLEDKAYYSIVEDIIQKLGLIYNQKTEKWLSEEDIINYLNLNSKEELFTLVSRGKIDFVSINEKINLYHHKYDADIYTKESKKLYLNNVLIKGFNHGYFLFKHESDLTHTFTKHLNKNSDYYIGFMAGVNEAKK